MIRHILFAAVAVCLIPTLSAAACPRPADAARIEAALQAGLNAVRAEHGLAALAPSSALDAAAQAHACDIAQRKSISHVSANGDTIIERLDRVHYNYRTAAENTGRGFVSADMAVDKWMHSPGHKKNILMRKAREIGIGIAVSDAPESRLHWVMVVGASQ